MEATLFRMFRGEVFKNKRELGLHLMFYFPILIYLIVDVYLLSHPVNETCSVNPWIYLSQRYMFAFYALLYPIVISIFCFSLLDIEYRNDYLKKMFTLPIRSSSVFGGKILYVVMTVFVSSLITYLLMLGSAFILEKKVPGYSFSSYDYGINNFIYFMRLFIATLSISSLHLWLSTVFRTFAIPIGIAGLGAIVTLISQKWDYVEFIPYFSVFDMQNKYTSGNNDLFGKVELINLVYIIIFLFLTLLQFTRLRNKR